MYNNTCITCILADQVKCNAGNQWWDVAPYFSTILRLLELKFVLLYTSIALWRQMLYIFTAGFSYQPLCGVRFLIQNIIK